MKILENDQIESLTNHISNSPRWLPIGNRMGTTGWKSSIYKIKTHSPESENQQANSGILKSRHKQAMAKRQRIHWGKRDIDNRTCMSLRDLANWSKIKRFRDPRRLVTRLADLLLQRLRAAMICGCILVVGVPEHQVCERPRRGAPANGSAQSCLLRSGASCLAASLPLLE